MSAETRSGTSELHREVAIEWMKLVFGAVLLQVLVGGILMSVLGGIGALFTILISLALWFSLIVNLFKSIDELIAKRIANLE